VTFYYAVFSQTFAKGVHQMCAFDRALRNPITGLFEGCAFAASDQTAEPAMTLMTSRRLIAAFRGSRQVIL
jgi:hypothetical protein